MRFNAKDRIEASADDVFAAVITPEALEAAARDKGVSVERSPDGPLQMGTAWVVGFTFRGKKRTAEMSVVELIEGERIIVSGASGGLDVDVTIDVAELNPRATRMSVALEVKPRSLTARLLVQSAKLARTKLEGRYRARVGQYFYHIANRVGANIS